MTSSAAFLQEGPLKYLSSTVFENCSTEMLRDFYMDNDYRKEWDKTLVDHQQLEVDEASGTEVGRTIKKFPLLTLREYVLAWRVWGGDDGTFYCFIKVRFSTRTFILLGYRSSAIIACFFITCRRSVGDVWGCWFVGISCPGP